MLNEITSHKLAGIFAKPLSERDAPGYKELVLRPTDLKSIRAAVSKGSRAAVAAIDALEAVEGDREGVGDDTPTKQTLKREDGHDDKKGEREGPVGGGMYLVTKTEELCPPKGIVNSAQLEMELTRMFANAVMFNPLPSDERGIGRSLRLRKFGGDLRSKIKREREDGDEDEGDSSEGSETESESGSSSGSDGGGIISDAREMFEDVVTSVGKWREVEVERIMGASASTSAGAGLGGLDGLGRQGSMSVSVSSALHREEEDDVGTPVAGGGGGGGGGAEGEGIGTSRKRRKVGD